MSETLLSLAGALAGSLLGILATNRLTVYRLSQLEKKVEKHNSLSERMTIVEQSANSAHLRLDELYHSENKERAASQGCGSEARRSGQ